MQTEVDLERETRTETLALIGIALVVMLVHLLTNGRYGFHRDEFQFLSDARHLEWGFVAYPPFTPFVERVGLQLFGVSMMGLRLFSVIAQALAIVVTGLMARELGGGRLAQVFAAVAVATSGLWPSEQIAQTDIRSGPRRPSVLTSISCTSSFSFTSFWYSRELSPSPSVIASSSSG